MPSTIKLNRRAVLKGIAGPSLALPVLEAMGHGTPVVTSAGTATAEVVGLENAFYLMGTAGIIAISLLAVWVARSPTFRG